MRAPLPRLPIFLLLLTAAPAAPASEGFASFRNLTSLTLILRPLMQSVRHAERPQDRYEVAVIVAEEGPRESRESASHLVRFDLDAPPDRPGVVVGPHAKVFFITYRVHAGPVGEGMPMAEGAHGEIISQFRVLDAEESVLGELSLVSATPLLTAQPQVPPACLDILRFREAPRTMTRLKIQGNAEGYRIELMPRPDPEREGFCVIL